MKINRPPIRRFGWNMAVKDFGTNKTGATVSTTNNTLLMGTAETMMPMSHDGLNTMSMKELKKELDVIGADYSRCIEKSELAKLLASNLKQGRKSKSQTKNNTTQEVT